MIYDSETTKWSQNQTQQTENLRFRFACLLSIDHDQIINRQLFTNVDEVVDYLEAIYQRTHHSFRIYVHNLDFDIKFLLQTLYLRYNCAITKNLSLLAVKCQQQKRKQNGQWAVRYDRNGKQHKDFITHFEFRDSCALFYHLSIKKLGQIVNLPKLDYDNNEGQPSEREIDYCYRDCEILHKSLILLRNMLTEFGLQNLAIEKFNLTLPALAMQLFLVHNAQYNKDIGNSRTLNQILDVPVDQNRFFRQTYYGGRTEIFDFNLYPEVAVLDINSLFPYIMTHFLFPLPPYHRYDYSDLAVLPDRNLICLFECEVNESNHNIPLLCEKINGKCMFLRNRKRVCIDEIEYTYLQRKGLILQTFAVWTCDQWIAPFQYFDQIYAQKTLWKKQNNPASDLAKLPMNATYGKFAEKSEKTDIKLMPISILDDIELLEEFNKDAKSVDVINNESVMFSYAMDSFTKTNVLWAKRVTDLSRFRLWRYIQQFSDLHATIINTDTDSCFIPLSDLPKVEHCLGDALGQFKVEAIYQNFQAIAPKEYMYCSKSDFGFGFLEFHQKSKGFALENGTILEYAYKAIKVVRPTKFSECFNRKFDLTTAVVMNKKKHSFYDKRKINSDLTTSALVFPTEINLCLTENQWAIRCALHNYYDKLRYLFPNFDESLFTPKSQFQQENLPFIADKKFSKRTMLKHIRKRLVYEDIDLDDSLIDLEKLIKPSLLESENYALVKEELMSYKNF